MFFICFVHGCSGGGGGMGVVTFPTYSLFTCLVTDSLQKAMKNNCLLKKKIKL